MRRALPAGLTAAALLALSAPAAAADTVYTIGACYDPSQPVVEQPVEVVYNCDSTGIMQNMTWTSWGADGAQGAGVDNAVECQPNCAQGTHLYNPIVVRAWNPKPAATPGCPPDVQFYSDLTIAYPQGVPPWIKPGTDWGQNVEFTYVDGMPAVHFLNQSPYSCTPLTR